jgi:protein-disulfide isomerase
MNRSASPKLDAHEVCNTLFRDGGAPTAGNPNRRVPIVVFLDYRCSYCRTLSGILSKLPNDHVWVVYKDWPVLGDSSVLAARAAVAAHAQGGYLAFHARLMASRLVPTASYLEDLASSQGLDVSRLRVDMNSARTESVLRQTSALASTLGLIGTPALVVGRTVVQGEISRSQLNRLIDDELRRRTSEVC